VLFDMDATRTLRCPGCQQHATARRQARPSRSSRGYGTAHRQLRDELIKQWAPGDPCAHCGGPMMDKTRLDLAHTEDRSGYRGLAHDVCNRGNR
jgi:hypothetical protein